MHAVLGPAVQLVLPAQPIPDPQCTKTQLKQPLIDPYSNWAEGCTSRARGHYRHRNRPPPSAAGLTKMSHCATLYNTVQLNTFLGSTLQLKNMPLH